MNSRCGFLTEHDDTSCSFWAHQLVLFQVDTAQKILLAKWHEIYGVVQVSRKAFSVGWSACVPKCLGLRAKELNVRIDTLTSIRLYD